MSAGEGSLAAGKMQGSIPITRRTHQCPWLGLRRLEVARPRAPVAMPAAPLAGRFGDHGGQALRRPRWPRKMHRRGGPSWRW